VRRRPLHGCPQCDLWFVPAAAHVSPEAEAARYRLHRNSRADVGYVRFLTPAVAALQRHARLLPPDPEVLDYGCGPAPVLVELLREAGFRARGYDPFFAAGQDLARRCAAVVSTETFEHFRRPAEDVARVVARVAPGGLLVVMTALHDGVADWPQWPYALDETHVAFFARATFDYIAGRWGLKLIETDGRRLVILRREGD
jgi:SAM-dependent methyltransferase